jgi:hypothetical protein
VTHYVTYAERCAEDTAAMHSICGLVKGHGLTSRWEQVTCPDCLAARPSGETPAPPRCAETRLTDDGTGGEFRCEGAAGHTGPHWWGAMTWSETPASAEVVLADVCRLLGVAEQVAHGWPQSVERVLEPMVRALIAAGHWPPAGETPAPPVPDDYLPAFGADGEPIQRPLPAGTTRPPAPPVPVGETDGYCRSCELLCHLKPGGRCDACGSNDTNRLSEQQIAALRSPSLPEPAAPPVSVGPLPELRVGSAGSYCRIESVKRYNGPDAAEADLARLLAALRSPSPEPHAPDVLREALDDLSADLFAALCEGDGEHTEALDRAIITAKVRAFLGAMGLSMGQPIETPHSAWTTFLAEWVDYNHGRGESDRAWEEFRGKQAAPESREALVDRLREMAGLAVFGVPENGRYAQVLHDALAALASPAARREED